MPCGGCGARKHEHSQACLSLKGVPWSNIPNDDPQGSLLSTGPLLAKPSGPVKIHKGIHAEMYLCFMQILTLIGPRASAALLATCSAKAERSLSVLLSINICELPVGNLYSFSQYSGSRMCRTRGILFGTPSGELDNAHAALDLQTRVSPNDNPPAYPTEPLPVSL